MKRIEWHRLCVVLVALLMISGCGSSRNLPDAYIGGSDFQYMNQMGTVFSSTIQKGEKCYYFRHSDYIYYLDEETDTLLPLCNKVDCLHDKETDAERLEDCNAYIKNDGYAGNEIVYSGGYVYCIDSRGLNEDSTLYRLLADGSGKEALYQWEENICLEQWIVHRGVLYYLEQTYLTEEDQVTVQRSLKALPLTGTIKRSREIYAVEDGMAIGTPPVAYGNYLYFCVDGVIDGEFQCNEYVYSILSGELSALAIPGMAGNEYVSSVAFWQEKLIVSPFIWDNYKNETLFSLYYVPLTYYSTELDGSGEKTLMENVLQGYLALSDGKYLYLTDAAMVEMAKMGYIEYEGPSTYWVYDSSLSLVDTITLPDEITSFGSPPIGDEEQMYIIYTDEIDPAKWGVKRWDKSKIGSYNGMAFEMETIPYGGD
ncbi:MAG: hypothetical protein ACI4AD_08600 [Roseburia sp.]